MPRVDDRAARVLARTQEFFPEVEDTMDPGKPSARRVSHKSSRSRASERIVMNNEEMDIDKVVQKVRERLSSPRRTTEKLVPTPPQTPPSNLNPRNSPKSHLENPSPKSYFEKPSPKSPAMKERIPVEEIRDVTYDPEPAEKKISPSLSYATFKKSTREELEGSLRSMNSEQLRKEILKLRSERTSIREGKDSRRIEGRQSEKIPVYDHESGTWVLYPKHLIESKPTPPPQKQVKAPLLRRGTTRDAYPTRTFQPEYEDIPQGRTNGYEITAVNPDAVEEVVDIDFDSMDEIQKREFLDEMKMKFAVLKKNYPNFPVPAIHDDDNPKWVYGIYEQLLDMAKGDASQPMYQTGLQVVFLILQVVLTLAGVPAKNFFNFHSRHFHKYNTLMVELGEKWGPIIDVTSSIETKLAISIGWNTVVFAVVSVIANKFGDKWGTGVEQLLEKITTSTDGINNPKMQNLHAELDGREEVVNEPQSGQGDQGDMMGGLANLLGGLMGGGGSGGGGIGNLLGGLMGNMANSATGKSATSTERKPPMYED